MLIFKQKRYRCNYEKMNDERLSQNNEGYYECLGGRRGESGGKDDFGLKKMDDWRIVNNFYKYKIGTQVLFLNSVIGQLRDREMNPEQHERTESTVTEDKPEQKKEKRRCVIGQFLPAIQFNMSLEDSAEEDNDILSDLKHLSIPELWDNSDYSKDEIKTAFESLLKITKKIHSKYQQCKERENQIKIQIYELTVKINELQQHNQTLQEDNQSIRLMMTELEQKKQQQIQQISQSEQEIKKSCLQISIELQNYKVMKAQLNRKQEQVSKKDLENKMLEVEIEKRNSRIKNQQKQINQINYNFTQLTQRLQQTERLLQNQREEFMRIQEENQQLHTKEEEYRYLLNHKINKNDSKSEEEFYLGDTSFDEKNKAILQCNQEDDHQMLKNIEKLCEEDCRGINPYHVMDLSFGKQSEKKIKKPYQEPFSERVMKISQNQELKIKRKKQPEDDKSSFGIRSISGISRSNIQQVFAERTQMREQLQKKYGGEISNLRRQNFRLKREIDERKSELIFVKDELSQREGQLEIRDDDLNKRVNPYRQAIYECSHLLEMERKRSKEFKEQATIQKIQLQAKINQLTIDYEELQANHKKLTKNLAFEIQKYVKKLIEEGEEQVQKYNQPQLKKKLQSIKQKKNQLIMHQTQSIHIHSDKNENSTQTQQKITKNSQAQIQPSCSHHLQQTQYPTHDIETQCCAKMRSIQIQTQIHLSLEKCFNLTLSSHKPLNNQSIQTESEEKVCAQTQTILNLRNQFIQTDRKQYVQKGTNKGQQMRDNQLQTSIEVEDKQIQVQLRVHPRKLSVKVEEIQLLQSFESQNAQNQLIIDEIDQSSIHTIKIQEENQQINKETYKKESKHSHKDSSGSLLKENTSSQNISSNHSRHSSKFTENKEQSIENVRRHKRTSSIRKSTFSVWDLDLSSSKHENKKNIDTKRETIEVMTERSIIVPKKTLFVDEPLTLKQEHLTHPEEQFLSKFINVKNLKKEKDIFSIEAWDDSKVYICQSKRALSAQNDKIVLWQTGLVSLTLKKGVAMRKEKRKINDSMLILGNCEVIAEGMKVSLKRGKKRNFFEGNLPDDWWKISKISVFSLQ